MEKIKNLIRTDLIQAGIVSEQSQLNYFRYLYLFFRSKTCRIQTFIRLRSSFSLLSFISKLYLDRFFIEVGKETIIGEYFYLPHPRCIIISNKVVIGNHVHIGQYVTIGGSFKKFRDLMDGTIQKLPIIGNNVIISPGAVIGGPVIIGNEVIVSANAVITRDVENNKVASGKNEISKKKINVPNNCGEFIVID
jgi:serine acetyltransferase